MAAKSGRNHLALSEELFADTHRFDFFQAVRILDWMARARGGDAAQGEDGQAHGGAHLAQRRQTARVAIGGFGGGEADGAKGNKISAAGFGEA